MKNNSQRIFGILLTAVLAAWTLGGCGSGKNEIKVEPMEAEEIHTLTFAALGGEDVMPIATYYGPMPSDYSYNGEAQPDFITEEYFEAIEATGINLINHTYTDYQTAPQLVRKMLELGEKYHIGICVTDGVISAPKGEDTLSLAQMSQRINEYGNYPAFCGMYMADEPQWAEFNLGDGTRTIDLYAPGFQNLAKLGIYGYANALPDYGFNGKSENYEAYLNYMVEKCELPYLQYDHYVFDKGATKEQYFYNMALVRKVAKEHDIPFWTFIQAGAQWNDANGRFDSETPYYPNELQFQWNVNTCLAYGAQGIEYFLLFQPYHFAFAETEPFDFERNGIFGAWGNKNQWYYYAQNVNRQIAAVDEVLMHSVNKGVLVTSEQARKDNELSDCILEGETWRELTGVDGDTMIGCFNYEGKTALYVVNYDTEYAQKITLHFDNTHNVSVVQNAEKTYYSAKNLMLDMQAGEGVLVVFD